MISIDDDSDIDFYTIQVSEPAQITATMTPVGSTYLSGSQTSQCNTGNSFNALTVANLEIAILGPNGSTVLASATANPAGVPEVAIAEVTQAGTYYMRIRQTAAVNSIQAYSLNVAVDTPPFPGIVITLPAGAPQQIEPGVATVFDVTIDPRDEQFVGAPALSSTARALRALRLHRPQPRRRNLMDRHAPRNALRGVAGVLHRRHRLRHRAQHRAPGRARERLHAIRRPARRPDRRDLR